LQENRGRLLDYGVFVPERPIFSHRLAAEHLKGDGWDRRIDLSRIRQTVLGDAVQSLEAALRSKNTVVVVISSEYFYHSDPAEVVSQFRDSFGSELDVVVSIRSQCDLALSGYNQDVKRLGTTAKRPRPEYRPIYDWSLLLGAWAQAVGKKHIKVISFDLSSRAGTILKDFVAAACPLVAKGLADGAFVENTWFNESLPADLLEFKRIANAWGEFGLSDWLEDALRSGYSGPRFGVSSEEANEWRALYDSSNQQVAKEYFSAPTASDIFPPAGHPDRGSNSEGQLPVETLAKLLAFAVMREQKYRNEVDTRIRVLERELADFRARLGEVK
jgi:hypothetical protein